MNKTDALIGQQGIKFDNMVSVNNFDTVVCVMKENRITGNKGICGQASIYILDWYPWLIPRSLLIWHLIDAPSTSWSTVSQESTNFWLIHASPPTLSRLSTDCWSSVVRVSTNYPSGCRSSLNQHVNQGYQSRVLIDTWLLIPLVHTMQKIRGVSINVGM